MLLSSFIVKTFIQLLRLHKINSNAIAGVKFITMSKSNAKPLLQKGLDVSWPNDPSIEAVLKMLNRNNSIN